MIRLQKFGLVHTCSYHMLRPRKLGLVHTRQFHMLRLQKLVLIHILCSSPRHMLQLL